MKASFYKRVMAYIIDMIILSMIISIISPILFSTKNAGVLKEELTTISDSFIKGDISTTTYINSVSEINYDIDYEMIGYTIIQFIIYVLYFIIYQFKQGGQTLGKRIMNIKIKGYNNKLTTDSLTKRSLIVNELFVIMLSLTAVLTISKKYYFSLIMIINAIQSLIIFISCIMILYRKDGRGLHDVFANTQVVIDKEKK